MQILDPEVENLIEKISKQFETKSIFLYGSRARGDHKEDSDYEIGVLYPRGKKVSRQELKEINPLPNVNLYSFEYESLVKGELDTPFPETLFIKEITSGGGLTLRGEKIVENVQSPVVKISHLLELVNFNVGVSLTAMLVQRAGDEEVARTLFYKACLFGARNLVILESGKFPLRYDDIYEQIREIDLEGHEDVLEKAIQARQGGSVSEPDFYRNMSFLTRIVRKRIREILNEQGDTILLN